MPVDCKICNDRLYKNGTNLVLCEHHRGFVHLNCCSDECSQHGAPCSHAVSEYTKSDFERVSPELFSLLE